jgi:hypothetical protein
MDIQPIVHRVCAEFIEMPGLRLTFAQAMRLWGLPPAVCRHVVDQLIGCGFLRLNAAGMLVRADSD